MFDGVSVLNLINRTNEILAGRYATPIFIMITNMGMGFLLQDLSPIMSKIFSNGWMKRLVIFAIVFSALREISATLVFCLGFILLFEFLLNERNGLCIIPAKYRTNKENKGNNTTVMENIKLQSASSQIQKEIMKLFDAYQNAVATSTMSSSQPKTPVSRNGDPRFINYKA